MSRASGPLAASPGAEQRPDREQLVPAHVGATSLDGSDVRLGGRASRDHRSRAGRAPSASAPRPQPKVASLPRRPRRAMQGCCPAPARTCARRLLQEVALARPSPFGGRRPPRAQRNCPGVGGPGAPGREGGAGATRDLDQAARGPVAPSPLRPDRRGAARTTHRARPPPPALRALATRSRFRFRRQVGSGSGALLPRPGSPATASAAGFVSTSSCGPGWPSAEPVTHFRRRGHAGQLLAARRGRGSGALAPPRPAGGSPAVPPRGPALPK